MRAVVGLCLAAAGTYAIRLGSVRLFGTRTVPRSADRTLRYAALGILASLAISSLPGDGGVGGLTAAGVGGAVAVVIAARRVNNIAAVMAVGVATYVLIDVM